jgi:hypothetical protein
MKRNNNRNLPGKKINWSTHRKYYFYRVIIVFTLILTGAMNCSRHYEKDLEFFQLAKGWTFYATDSLSFSDTTFFREKWSSYESANQLRDWLKVRNSRFLWCRNDFILDGHFTSTILFLKLTTILPASEVILNHQQLKYPKETIELVNNTPLQQNLFRINNPDLHFGKRNTLLIALSIPSPPDSIFHSPPGIYSGSALLKNIGIPVQECSYKMERNSHSFLEDFALSWQKPDSEALRIAILPGSNQASQNIAILSDAIEIRKPSEIELYEPEFFCLPSRSSIIVLAEWLFHYPDRETEAFPFSWELKKADKKWYVYKFL